MKTEENLTDLREIQRTLLEVVESSVDMRRYKTAEQAIQSYLRIVEKYFGISKLEQVMQ